MAGRWRADPDVHAEGGGTPASSPGRVEYTEPAKGAALLPLIITAAALWLVLGGVYAPEIFGIAPGRSDLILWIGVVSGGVVPLALHYLLKRRAPGTLVLDEEGIERRAVDGRRVRLRWPEVTSLRWGGFIPRGLTISDGRGRHRVRVTTFFDDFDEIAERVVERTVGAHRHDPEGLTPPTRFWRLPRGWVQAWAVVLVFGLPSALTISHGLVVMSVLCAGLLVGQLAAVSRIAIEDGRLLERGGLRWRGTALRRVEEVELEPPRSRRGGRGTEVDPPRVGLQMSTGERRVIRAPSVLALWAAIEVERRMAAAGEGGDPSAEGHGRAP